jgi:hypothetical protein
MNPLRIYAAAGELAHAAKQTPALDALTADEAQWIHTHAINFQASVLHERLNLSKEFACGPKTELGVVL